MLSFARLYPAARRSQQILPDCANWTQSLAASLTHVLRCLTEEQSPKYNIDNVPRYIRGNPKEDVGQGVS